MTMTLYYNLSPNPMKVVLALEELERPFEAVAVDTRRGEQFAERYRALNPNGKVPTLVEDDVAVFDSNAILLHLAETSGRFGPSGGPAARAEFLSWMMFVATGIGPFSGQAVHFRHFAPEPVPYADTRYQYEAARHYGILDARLAGRDWIAGDAYSVADMAAWGWTRMVPFILGDEAWGRFPNVKRHLEAVSARPAAARAEAFRQAKLPLFKAGMDAEARAHMFKHVAA